MTLWRMFLMMKRWWTTNVRSTLVTGGFLKVESTLVGTNLDLTMLRVRGFYKKIKCLEPWMCCAEWHRLCVEVVMREFSRLWQWAKNFDGDDWVSELLRALKIYHETDLFSQWFVEY